MRPDLACPKVGFSEEGPGLMLSLVSRQSPTPPEPVRGLFKDEKPERVRMAGYSTRAPLLLLDEIDPPYCTVNATVPTVELILPEVPVTVIV